MIYEVVASLDSSIKSRGDSLLTPALVYPDPLVKNQHSPSSDHSAKIIHAKFMLYTDSKILIIERQCIIILILGCSSDGWISSETTKGDIVTSDKKNFNNFKFYKIQIYDSRFLPSSMKKVVT